MPGHNNLAEHIGKQPILCSNLGFGEQGSVLTTLSKAIFVCPNIENVYKMRDQLTALNKDCVIIDEFDKSYTLSTFKSTNNKIDTIKALEKMHSNNCIIISTPQILFSNIISPELFKSKSIFLEKDSL